VLVTGVGGPAGVAVMQSLAAASMELWAADIDPYAVGLYLLDGPRRRLLVPPGGREDFPGFLLELCRRERIDAVVPTVDCELLPLALRRGEFERAGTRLVLAHVETLRVCLDKWTLHERCAGSVPMPATTLLDERFDPKRQKLPVIVKPRVGSGSRGVRTIAHSDASDAHPDAFDAHPGASDAHPDAFDAHPGASDEHPDAFADLPRDGSLLVQELLPGIEYSLDVLADLNGRVLAVVPRSRLKVDSGIAVAGRTLHDERLQRIGARVAELIGLTGVANVQVKNSARGEPALLEVNPRFPGTMPLTVAAGIDPQRRRLPVHHPDVLRDRPADRQARVAPGDHVPRRHIAGDHPRHVLPAAAAPDPPGDRRLRRPAAGGHAHAVPDPARVPVAVAVDARRLGGQAGGGPRAAAPAGAPVHLPRRLWRAAVRDHALRLRQGGAGRGHALGEDREDGQGGGRMNRAVEQAGRRPAAGGELDGAAGRELDGAAGRELDGAAGREADSGWDFEQALLCDRRHERSLLVREALVILLIAALLAARALLL
jgi:carbamoyl-phosphate synthase large subunit